MKSISLVMVAALLSTACASMTIGEQPSATPPQLVRAQGGGIVWDTPGAFGPVPPAVAAKGAARCALLNTASQTYRALGYHPYAKDMGGQLLPEGGFYCVPN